LICGTTTSSLPDSISKPTSAVLLLRNTGSLMRGHG
jgi:hypothetical protein